MRKFLAACMAIVMIFTIAGCSSEGHEGEAKTPSGSSIQKGKDYQKVVDEFESSGFTNIKLEKLDDLVTGWLTKDGEVESVSVDGDTGYSADAWYPADVEVIITYHTFPEKETSESDSESVSTETPAADILTVDNSPELAAILSLKADMDQSYADFAEAHKNQVIEFNGWKRQHHLTRLFLSPKRNTRNFADSMVVFLSRLTGYRPTKRNLPSATGAELSTIRSGRSGSAYRAAISKIRMKAPSSIMMRLQTTGTRLDAPDTLPMVSRISLMWKRK